MIEKQPSSKPGRVRVTFRVERGVWADQVTLIGDFDSGGQQGLPMRQTAADPDWHISLELEEGRRYTFAYLIDNRQWSVDYSADGCRVDARGSTWSIVDTCREERWAEILPIPARQPVSEIPEQVPQLAAVA